MKKILLTLLFLTACSENSSLKLPARVTSSIINNWQLNGASNLLKLQSYSLYESGDANDLIMCNGTFSDSSTINGVEAGKILISGTSTSGIIQIGNLADSGASNPNCSSLSGKEFMYEVTTGTSNMKLCEIISNTCENYSLVP